MGQLSRVVSINGQVTQRNLGWVGIPLFVRSCFETEEEPLPRLKATDLQDPQNFHLRLTAFLMKQH